MNRVKFSRICRVAAAGQDQYMENTRTHHAGKLLSCLGERAEIDIYGKRETWHREECRELERPNFDFHLE